MPSLEAVEPTRRLILRSLPDGQPNLRKMRRRWWLFILLDLVARYWPVTGRRRGLLVVRIDGIGDMVLFRKALDHYAATFRVDQRDITVLGCRSWQNLADTVFAGYRVHAIDEHAFERKPFYRFREALWVRRQNFAIACCDSFFRKALIADSLVWLSTAPRRVLTRPWTSARTQAEFAFYARGAEVVDTGTYPTHEIVRHATFLARVGGTPVSVQSPTLGVTGKNPVLPGPSPYVVLNFGCNEPGRRWPFASYRIIAERLLDRGYRVVLVGTKREATELTAHRNFLERPGVINLVGRTSLTETAAAFAGAAAVLTNDTGPGHLSIAVGAPTVMMIGGGHFGSFVPYPDSLRPDRARFVYREMPCYHCFWNCDHPKRREGESFPCLSAIAPDEVWRDLLTLLPNATAAAVAHGSSLPDGRTDRDLSFDHVDDGREGKG